MYSFFDVLNEYIPLTDISITKFKSNRQNLKRIQSELCKSSCMHIAKIIQADNCATIRGHAGNELHSRILRDHKAKGTRRVIFLSDDVRLTFRNKRVIKRNQLQIKELILSLRLLPDITHVKYTYIFSS